MQRFYNPNGGVRGLGLESRATLSEVDLNRTVQSETVQALLRNGFVNWEPYVVHPCRILLVRGLPHVDVYADPPAALTYLSYLLIS